MPPAKLIPIMHSGNWEMTTEDGSEVSGLSKLLWVGINAGIYLLFSFHMPPFS